MITKERLRVQRFADTLNKFGLNDQKLAEKLAQRYVETSPYQTQLFPGTIPTLQLLKEQGYHLHIITNGFKEVQFIKLENSKIIDFFDVILCSEDVGHNKPHPDIFLEAMSRANTTATNSVMIGDDLRVDVGGAENIGIKGVLFDPKGKYDFNTHPYIIKRLSQFPEILPWL